MAGGTGNDEAIRGSARSDGDPETRAELLACAAAYARTVDLPVDHDAITWEVSERAKRRAGVCRYDAGDGTVTIRLAWRAYEAHGWERFRRTIRHELIHAWEFQEWGEAGHGERFAEKAAALDVDRHCEAFTAARLRAVCTATDCDWAVRRYRASATVTRPERYGCGACGADYAVVHRESGRRWETSEGYERARAAIGDEW